MIKFLIKFLLITIFLIPVTSLRSQQVDLQREKDSILMRTKDLKGDERLRTFYKLQTIAFTYEESIDSVRKYSTLFIDEAKRQNRISAEASGYTNLIGAYYNRAMRKEIMEETPEILKLLIEKKAWDYYYSTYSILLNTYFDDKKYHTTLEKTNEMLEMALSQNNSNGLATSYFTMAEVYNKMGRTADAAEYYTKCIDQINSQKEMTVPYAYRSYGFLFEINTNQNKWEEGGASISNVERSHYKI